MLIKIKNLRVQTIIGVYDFEKKANRELIFNVEITTHKYKKISDNLADTLDYDSVVEIIVKEAEKSRYDLIETLAHDLAEKLIKVDGIDQIKIEIDKPGAIKNADSASVTVESKKL